jgi:hypothetical protein
MSYATRKKTAHNRIRSTFGVDADASQLYVWHNGTQVTAYQPSGSRGRNLLASLIVKDETITVHATKEEFTTVPVPGDTLLMGTTQASARSLRIDAVKTTHIQPWYELDLIDPNVATTAPAA